MGIATPLLYVYLVLLFPKTYARWLQLLLCFAMGLCIDMFTNTPGLAAASMTLTGFIQPYILDLYLSEEDNHDLMPGFKTLGKMAIGGALMYSLVSALSDSGGQQSNAQLYGQQPLY